MEFQLACIAVRNAAADAGVALDGIDGIVSSMDRNDPGRLSAALARASSDAYARRPSLGRDDRVLGIGAGYGVVSGIVLKAFPNARVTLQDYSTPMLEQAKQRLAAFAGRTSFALADLTDESWTAAVGGPFDLAVSTIAIHNLRDPQLIERVYEGVRSVLKPVGVEEDADYVFAGGLDAHLDMLRRARFEHVSGDLKDEHLAILAAYAAKSQGAVVSRFAKQNGGWWWITPSSSSWSGRRRTPIDFRR